MMRPTATQDSSQALSVAAGSMRQARRASRRTRQRPSALIQPERLRVPATDGSGSGMTAAAARSARSASRRVAKNWWNRPTASSQSGPSP